MFVCFANGHLFGPSILLNSLFLLLYKYAILWYIKIPIYSPATGHLSFSLLYLYLYQYFTDLITVLLSFTVNKFLWYYFSFGYFSYLLFQMNMRVACWTDWKKLLFDLGLGRWLSPWSSCCPSMKFWVQIPNILVKVRQGGTHSNSRAIWLKTCRTQELTSLPTQLKWWVPRFCERPSLS